MNLFSEYTSKAYQDSKPIFTTVELTHKCNFSCLHCYNFDRTIAPPKNIPQLGTELVLNFLEELKNEGGLIVNFSGGEPMLHPDIYKIIKKTKELNLIPRLKTNAFFLNQKSCEKLKEHGLEAVDISMYGFSNETYNDFSKSNKGFDHFLIAVDSLIAQEINIQINIIVHRANFKQLDQMIIFCKDKNLPFEISCDITDRYDQTKPSTTDVIISDAEFEKLLRGPHGDHFKTSSKPDGFQCSCARSVCGLSVNGDIYPCIGAPIPSGNLKNDSFHEIWNNSTELNKIRNIKTESFKSCVTCDVQNECIRSSGEVFINTGDYLGCDPATLKKAQLRKKVQTELG